MVMLLVSMTGRAMTPPRSGFVQQGDKVTFYKIIFKGEITSDVDRESVEVGFANFFKVPIEKVSTLFNGKSYYLMKKLEVDNAISIQKRLLKIGVVTHLVKEEEKVEKVATQDPVDNKPLNGSSKSDADSSHNNQESTDIWLTIKTTATFIGLISVIACIFVYSTFSIHENKSIYLYLFAVMFTNIIFSKFTLSIWNSYSLGIIADVESDSFSFPASDVENSIIDILTLKKFKDMAKRNSYPITQIRALNNETKRWTTKSKNAEGRMVSKNHIVWMLNVSGDFGSQQFQFSSKQKRDECRSMLFTATRKLGNKSRGSSDFNFDS
jgi:hypothetical protein